MSPQAGTMNQPQRVPLVTTFGNRSETLTKDAKLVNCIAEKDDSTGSIQIQKRVGLENYKAYSGAGQGIYNWNGDVYSIFNGTVRKGDTIIGAVDAANGRYRFVQMLGTPARLVFGNGTHLYYTDGSTINEIQEYQIPTSQNLQIDTAQVYIPAPWYFPVPRTGQGWLLTTPGRGNHYEVVSVGTTDFTKCGFLSDSSGGSSVLSNGSFTIGNDYIINSRVLVPSNGTQPTNFTAIGSESNEVGTPFKATATGYSVGGVLQGDGTVRPACTNTVGARFYATRTFEGSGTAALTAWGMVVGQFYRIRTVGDTDFTLYGASANTVGTTFTCTKVLATYSASCGTLDSPNFPSTTKLKGVVYLDGRLYVMDSDAAIYGSKYTDDPTVWDPLNKIVARVEPDKGVGLAKQLAYVVALKEWTSEVFYDAGNSTGSPLAPVAGAKSPYGCVSMDSVVEIDDVLYWISSNRTVSPQIVSMEDLRVRVISTTSVDRQLDQADFSEVFAFGFKHGGHKFYCVTIKNENLTLVYDISQGLWYQWTDYLENYWPIVGETFSPTSLHVVQHETNGKLFYLEGDYEYPDDAGEIFPVDIVTPRADFSIDRRKVCNQMRFNADKVANSTLSISVSDDDYQTWSSPRTVNLDHKRPILSQCGTFYRRAWWIRHQAATAFRITSIDLQLDIGTL